jgi:N-acyl amino acid synthase of PEP-CTERM/exosortase system
MVQAASEATQHRLAPSFARVFPAPDRDFAGIAADTPELLQAAHRLRYQVFCVENKIFDPADNPGGLERDAYDAHAAQALLLHRPTRAFFGTVRLVLHKPGAVEGSLPFHRVCRDPRFRDPAVLPLATTAEVGRFALSKAYRLLPSQCDRGYAVERSDALDRLLPVMTLALIKTALRLCVLHRVSHVCAVMEPKLLRLLGRLGFHFAPAGPMVDYYGRRQPCFAELDTLFARVGDERHEIWAVTTDRGRAFAETPHPSIVTRVSARFGAE